MGTGITEGYLGKEDIRKVVKDSLASVASVASDGQRLLVLVPDNTRTMPVPHMFDLFEEFLSPRVSQLDYLIALGTHPPFDDTQLSRLVGRRVQDGKVGNTHIFNHQWQNADSFVWLGTIPSEEIKQITGGILCTDVSVQLN
jgi:hypothetical protein